MLEVQPEQEASRNLIESITHLKTDNEWHLSSAQMSVWRALRLNPANIGFGIWDYLRISGGIDRQRLMDAIADVCDSAPGLHLQFSGSALNPRQQVIMSHTVVPFVDLANRPDPAKEALEWMVFDHGRGFELSGQKLFRTAILGLNDNTVYWYRNYHHLVADGFSTMLLGARTSRAYQAGASSARRARFYGRNKVRGYDAYLRYEASYRQSDQYARDRAYWSAYHRQAPAPLSLSVRTITANRDHMPLISSIWTDSALWNGLDRLSLDIGVDVGPLLIALITIYVHKASGEPNVPICVPTHGRETTSTMSMVGMCTNLLGFQFRLDPRQTHRETIRDIAEQIAEGLQHRQYRREDLLKDLGIGASESFPFKIHANIVRSAGEWIFSECPARGEPGCGGPVDDLMFLVVESRNESRFRITLLGNPALYEKWELDAHLKHLVFQMLSITSRSHERLCDLPLVSETAQLAGVRTRPLEPALSIDQSFHRLFETQAARTPDAIAIAEAKGTATYAEIDTRANRLAHSLVSLGVKRNDIVGICVDRSIEMIVGIIGILKAGAAYMPLDPDAPASRLSFMIRDAHARIILTHAVHQLILPDHLVQLVFLDASEADGQLQPGAAPHVASCLEDLAYVIYTSGSTGEPKGVLIQQSSLCNLIAAQRAFVSLEAANRVMQFSRFSFDVFVSELAMTLTAGATLFIRSKLDLALENLGQTLRSAQIEVISISPSALSSISPEDVPTLTTVIVAGEECPVGLAKRWSASCRFINAYGPTETTVYATYYEFRKGDRVPIGRSLAGVETYILDRDRRQAAIGIVGEIYIGGAGVALGYLHRDRLTAEHFLADPFSAKPGSKMYRTGDLARWLPSGDIEYLGRIDHQVKIKGFRIELGEVEAALAAVVDVLECVVVADETAGRKQLVSYLVASNGELSGDSRRLRRALSERLPAYMIPSVFIYLDALPRTLSGKVDRKRLPSVNDSLKEREFSPPMTESERLLAIIWAQALHLERVSCDDNFVDVGGDSLAVLAAIEEIRKIFAIDLPAYSIYEAANLRELASAIDRLKEESI
jgi:glyine---[glycyl-carrier protein] ligase